MRFVWAVVALEKILFFWGWKVLRAYTENSRLLSSRYWRLVKVANLIVLSFQFNSLKRDVRKMILFLTVVFILPSSEFLNLLIQWNSRASWFLFTFGELGYSIGAFLIDGLTWKLLKSKVLYIRRRWWGLDNRIVLLRWDLHIFLKIICWLVLYLKAWLAVFILLKFIRTRILLTRILRRCYLRRNWDIAQR